MVCKGEERGGGREGGWTPRQVSNSKGVADKYKWGWKPHEITTAHDQHEWQGGSWWATTVPQQQAAVQTDNKHVRQSQHKACTEVGLQRGGVMSAERSAWLEDAPMLLSPPITAHSAQRIPREEQSPTAHSAQRMAAAELPATTNSGQCKGLAACSNAMAQLHRSQNALGKDACS